MEHWSFHLFLEDVLHVEKGLSYEIVSIITDLLQVPWAKGKYFRQRPLAFCQVRLPGLYNRFGPRSHEVQRLAAINQLRTKLPLPKDPWGDYRNPGGQEDPWKYRSPWSSLTDFESDNGDNQ